MARKALMLLATLLVVAFASSSALADDAQDCRDKWDDAPASDYCSNVTVTWWEAGELCRINGSCSISVSVDNTQTTFTPNLNKTKSKTNTGTLDICFQYRQTSASFEASILQSCSSSAYTSSDATTNGLTSPSS